MNSSADSEPAPHDLASDDQHQPSGSTEESRYNNYNVNTGLPHNAADGTRLFRCHQKSS